MAAVVVRWARIDRSPVRLEGASEREQLRLASLQDGPARRRFVGARTLLRATVAEFVRCAPGAVVVRQVCERCGGPHGRPRVELAGRPGPEVSVAHAGPLAIVAVGSAPVGIDLEPLEPLGARAVELDLAGLRTWVRTEAVLKATGHGLEVDPRLVGFSAPTSPPRLQRWDGPGRRPALRMADLEPDPGYVAALARLGRAPLRVDAAWSRFRTDRAQEGPET